MGVAYEIGPFQLDPEAGVLIRDGTPTALGARAVAVLHALVEHANEFVPKGRILDAAWPNLVVEEANLAVQIGAIRRVLSEAGGERWIETLTGRGYRFVGPLTKVASDRSQDAGGRVRRSTLPEALTSFIGRERELAEIKRLLPGKRLLTLVGAGGVGKTRLALQFAAELVDADAYRDGVWLVELAPVADPALVPQAVATVLGLKEQPGKSLTQTLIEYLASKHLLLLVDNAEHLLAACAQLADALLRQCPHIVLLATSREGLGIAGELTYRVPSLSMPDPRQHTTPEQLSQYESIRLLVERARLQLPHFTVTDQNAPALASVCYRLDGIPLALELAAARMRSMSVEEVDRRLDHRFSLLKGGSRTAPTRQQTLRSLIDWSYDLLHEAEKALLCRLSVFAGGWTLAAAEAVCDGEGVEKEDVLDILTSLGDKSLVGTEERSGATRYGLLETVRQYARDQLREGGDVTQWRSRHLAHFIAVAEEAEPQLRGADQQAWLDQLETEHDNLRSALGWSAAAGGDDAGGLRLAGALCRFWSVRGYLGEGRGWVSGLLAAATGRQAAAARAKALNGAGGLARHQGDNAAARALFEQSLAIYRELGDRQRIAFSLNNLGVVADDQGDYPAARALHEESLAIQRELGDKWSIAMSLHNLGVLASDQGDHRAARALHEESLAIRRELGDWQGIGDSLNSLGSSASEQGDYAAARALFEESLAIQRELGDRQSMALSLSALGNVASAQGDNASARALHEETLTIYRELGDRRGIARSLVGLAYVAFALAGPGRAARIWAGAERLRETIGEKLPPSDCAGYDRQIAAARAAIGDDATFDLAWQEGRAMTLERAIEYALNKPDA
jgi:predicted ATPase/DNA-binding winged helix-turn-helix (wHTH) protein/Tfp pilus assembly protein PilF